MDYPAPAWLPGGHLQTIYPARGIARAGGGLPARTLGRAGRRLRRCRFRRRPAGQADGGAVPRPRRLVRQPLRERHDGRSGRARLVRRGAAFPRLLGRSEPRAALLPLGRRRRDRLDPAPPARAHHGQAVRDRRLAGRQRAAALAGRIAAPGRTRRRRLRGVGAARPGARRRGAVVRLQPHLHPHVPAHAEAEMPGQAGGSFPACSTATPCSPRATCTRSTTW